MSGGPPTPLPQFPPASPSPSSRGNLPVVAARGDAATRCAAIATATATHSQQADMKKPAEAGLRHEYVLIMRAQPFYSFRHL